MVAKKIRACVLVAALALTGIAGAQTTTPATSGARTTTPATPTQPVALSTGQARVADRFAAPFAKFAGSSENAVALATALRTGTPATLSYTVTSKAGETTTTTTTIEPPTRPMGWGNVAHSLALAQYSLAQAGVTNPSGADISAALVGGSVTVDGQTVDLAGVLAQRASGMGWGQIARSYSTTMGTANRAARTSATAASTTPSVDTEAPQGPQAAPASRTPATAGEMFGGRRGAIATAAGTTTSASGRGLTTAGGTSAGSGQGKGLTTAGGSSGTHGSPKGITTASGIGAGTGAGAKGLTTASGEVVGGAGGIVSADGGAGRGQGHAYGRGIVTASGNNAATAGVSAAARSSSGVVNAGGTGGAVISAQPDRGGGQGHGNGRGKGGG